MKKAEVTTVKNEFYSPMLQALENAEGRRKVPNFLTKIFCKLELGDAWTAYAVDETGFKKQWRFSIWISSLIVSSPA